MNDMTADITAFRDIGGACPHDYHPGIAIQQTYTGIGDFHEHDICTFSAGGPGKVIEVMKCSKCGHSYLPPTKPTHEI